MNKKIEELLKDIKVSLSNQKKKKVDLKAEATLDGGQKIMTPADEWGEGVEAFMIPSSEEGDAEPQPLEKGEYDLEGGGKIVVNEEGKVESFTSPSGDNELSDEAVSAIADKVIEKLDLSSHKTVKEFEAKLSAASKREEDLVEIVGTLNEKVTELSSAAEDYKKQKKEKKKPEPTRMSAEDFKNLTREQRMALKIQSYKS